MLKKLKTPKKNHSRNAGNQIKNMLKLIEKTVQSKQREPEKEKAKKKVGLLNRNKARSRGEATLALTRDEK